MADKRTYRRWTENEDLILTAIARRKDTGAPTPSWSEMARRMGRDLTSVRNRLARLRAPPEDDEAPEVRAPKPPPVMRRCNCCGRQFQVTPRRRMLCALCFATGDGGIDV